MEDLASGIREGYDRWSPIYDHDLNPLPALEEPVVRAAAGEVKGLRVLDLGCGTGRHTVWLAQGGAHVTAVDFSEGMLAQARQKLGAHAVRWLVHDLHQALPFENGEFDLIVNGLVLEHLNNFVAFFVEMRRVLKPRGRAIISTLHPAMFLRGSQARFTDPETGEVIQPGSIAHTFGEMVLAPLRAGFELADIAELSPTAEFAARFPRAEKYIGWPMLVVMTMVYPIMAS